MSSSIKFLFIIVCAISTVTSHSQERQEYVFENIGWKITIPMDFTLYDFIDEARNMQEPSGGADEFDPTSDLFLSQTNILAIKDRFNYFNITTSRFDPEEDGSWENTVQSWKNEAYNNMVKIIEGGRLDTLSSIEYIDGIAFNKFHIAVSFNNVVQQQLFLLSKLYKGYDFNISYLSLDKDARKQIELMLGSSRFNRNN